MDILDIQKLPRIRSLLFVPGNKPNWILKGFSSGADAIVIDLEDAVPNHEKQQARESVKEFLVQNERLPGPVLVRVNAPDTSLLLSDVQALAPHQLTGIMVPKIESLEDVHVIDRVLDWFEHSPQQSMCIVPVLETAWAMRHAYDIAKASTRIAYMGGITSKGGDIQRAIGYQWSTEGYETYPLRSQILLDARAARVHNPLSGLWSDVQDLAGLRKFAQATRNMGYEGLTVIHPSHIQVVNEIFSPTEKELEYDRALVRAMREAQQQGRGAVQFDGHMIDEAMAQTSIQRLARYSQETRIETTSPNYGGPEQRA